MIAADPTSQPHLHHDFHGLTTHRARRGIYGNDPTLFITTASKLLVHLSSRSGNGTYSYTLANPMPLTTRSIEIRQWN
jgi:hypothetical protein